MKNENQTRKHEESGIETKVLVIEDECRDVFLRAAPKFVDAPETVQEAVARLKTNKYDALLIDSGLYGHYVGDFKPDMGDWILDALRQGKYGELNKSIPAFGISLTYVMGAEDFLKKPIKVRMEWGLKTYERFNKKAPEAEKIIKQWFKEKRYLTA